MTYGKQLRDLLHKDKIIIAPGVFDGLSALLTKKAGFSVVYASGGAIARSMGYPDLGLLTLTEVCARLSSIVEVAQMPVIADADTGFGNVLNVQRTVGQLAQLGMAGFHIEDQTFPKRCGHLEDKSLISLEEMCQKIKVARVALTHSDCILIARTDAIAVEGLEKALIRARAYQEAGADMLFVEAPQSIEQIEQIADALPGLKLINMFQGGKTPMVPVDYLQKLGYQLVIIPSDLQRAAIKSMQKTLDAIYQCGNSNELSEAMVSFKERELIVETQKYLDLDKA